MSLGRNSATPVVMETADQQFSVLRVGTYPTEEHNGVGLPGYMLSADQRYATVYRTPLPGGNEVPLEPPGDRVDLRFFPFADRAMPENRRLSPRTVVATLRRMVVVSWLNARVLLDRAARRVNLVHIHSPMWAPVAAYAKLSGRPAVITVHGTDFIRLRKSGLLRILLTPIDRILCVSDVFAQELAVLFPNKSVETVYNGVDTVLFSPSATPAGGRRKQIVAVGSLRWHRDHATLIQAFSQLAAANPGWSLAIVGGGELRSDLEQRVAELGLQKRVRFLGALSHQALAKELAASEIFALSSVIEGLPKVLLEAMASGCACIATDVGECRAVLSDAGLILPAREASLFANALATLISSADLRKAYGARGESRAHQFTWDAYRDRHYKIYRGLLENDG